MQTRTGIRRVLQKKMAKQGQKVVAAEVEQQGISFGWGESLRQARIAQGLSINEVSTQLHFDVSLVENIESEVLEKLPPASFVKGYLRNYARQLDIDPEPIVAAYNEVCGNEAPVISKVVRFKESSSRDAGPRYITWLVLAGLIIPMVFWWRSEVLKPAVVDTEQAVPESGQFVSVVPEIVAVPEMIDEPIIGPAVEEVIAAVPEPATETPLLSTLALTFEQDSWIEVHDAQGKRLYMDMAKAGQSKTVEGEAPFKLLLGNAPAVTVEYNGDVYDHSKHNRKGVARFTLGE